MRRGCEGAQGFAKEATSTGWRVGVRAPPPRDDAVAIAATTATRAPPAHMDTRVGHSHVKMRK